MSTSAFAFKNGFALLQQSYAVPANADVFVLPELPVEFPAHGTFWLEGSAAVVSVHTSAAETKGTDRPALTVEELLVANRGEQLGVLVSLGPQQQQWFDGVVQVPEYVSEDALPGMPRRTRASIVNIEGGPNGTLTVALGQVLLVRGAKKTLFHDVAESKGIVVRLSPQPAGTTLRVMALAKGLTWAPSYKAQLLEDQRLVLSGHACILNDAVSVREFDLLTCLAGVPNLAFSHVTDPMAQQQQVAEFLSSLDSSGDGVAYRGASRRPNVMSNMMSQQMSYGGGFGGNDGDSDSKPQESADDLHQYRFRTVILPKGFVAFFLPFHFFVADFVFPLRSRVLLELFPTVELKYRDVHQAEVTLSAYPQRNDAATIDVWHSIKVANNSSCPWTTGPVLVTRGAEQGLVCQSSLTYTSVGSDAQVKLTKSMAVSVNHEESVDSNSKSQTKKVLERSYLRVDASGSFLLRNQKGVAVTLCLTVNLTGDLLTSSVPPTKNTEVGGSDMSNASRVVLFDATLAPRETKLIKYTRMYYVSH